MGVQWSGEDVNERKFFYRLSVMDKGVRFVQVEANKDGLSAIILEWLLHQKIIPPDVFVGEVVMQWQVVLNSDRESVQEIVCLFQTETVIP